MIVGFSLIPVLHGISSVFLSISINAVCVHVLQILHVLPVVLL